VASLVLPQTKMWLCGLIFARPHLEVLCLWKDTFANHPNKGNDDLLGRCRPSRTAFYLIQLNKKSPGILSARNSLPKRHSVATWSLILCSLICQTRRKRAGSIFTTSRSPSLPAKIEASWDGAQFMLR